MRPTQRHRVLIVDDDDSVLWHRARQLGEVFDVECATNAHTAFTHVCAATFRAVVTDFEMPGQDGLWLLERVRATRPDVRRVLTSGQPVEVFEEALRVVLVHAFLPKPASLDEALAAIGLVDDGAGVERVA